MRAPGTASRRCVLAGVLLLAVAGCASHDGDHATTAPRGSEPLDHAEADVEFATMMVPHHLQALEMAGLVPDRTKNAALLELAARIRSTQQKEVEEMTGWLAGWGAAPMEDHDALEGHGAAGMMSADDLRELGTLRDDAFDRRWLEMMVEHHEGAVAMATQVLRDGEHAGTRIMANAVVRDQTAEIAEMKALLGD